MNQEAIITEFRKLSSDEKAGLLDLLWDEYAIDASVPALSDEQVGELNRRMDAYRTDPGSAVDAADVFREMRSCTLDCAAESPVRSEGSHPAP